MKDEKLFVDLNDEQSEKLIGGAGRAGNPGFTSPWPALTAAGFVLTHNANADNGDNGSQNIDVGIPGRP